MRKRLEASLSAKENEYLQDFDRGIKPKLDFLTGFDRRFVIDQIIPKLQLWDRFQVGLRWLVGLKLI